MALVCDVCGSGNVAWDYTKNPPLPFCRDCGGSVTVPDSPDPEPQKEE